MSYKQPSLQLSFSDIALQKIMEKYENHSLVRISNEFPFEMFRKHLNPLYSENGRPGFDPVCLLRVVILGKLQNLSDNRLSTDVSVNILYRQFCGFSLEDETPYNSTISRFRDRIAPVWENIWLELRVWLLEHNYIDDELITIDSTAISARTNYDKSKDNRKNDDDKRDYSVQNDPDARFGKKSDKNSFYGYKAHVGTDGNAFIVAADLTGGNMHDGFMFPDLVMHACYFPKQATADKSYWSRANQDFLREIGIGDYIIPQGKKSEELEGVYRKRRKIERVFSFIKIKGGLFRTRFIGQLKVGLDVGFAIMAYNINNLLRFC